QLRSTVSQYGVTSEPVRQMLDYLWGSQVLLPADIKAVMKLILSQHQQLFLGLDLAAAVDVEILTTAAHRVPTATKGPLVINGTPMGALIIRCSSASLMGLIVMPGLLDADYTGLIYVMVWTLAPPIRISKGARIAQLVPLPQFTKSITPLSSEQRKDKGFGSSGGLALLTMDLSARPRVRVTITYRGSDCILDGLLDTGADSSIVDPSHWPQNWPMLPSMIAVTGVGGLTLAKKS
ncbi:POK9 protein, partial [Pteruthius melanotis]|nr:POK9 protein [Pteruthius melanotis]